MGLSSPQRSWAVGLGAVPGRGPEWVGRLRKEGEQRNGSHEGQERDGAGLLAEMGSGAGFRGKNSHSVILEK